MPAHELICCIVNHDKGSRVLQVAKRHGISGGTVMRARGTVKDHLLEILGLDDARREFVMMVAGERSDDIMQNVCREMAFHKPGHGIAFTIPFGPLFGTREAPTAPAQKMEDKAMYHAIFTIVDRGQADAVIEAANAAGARGGTVLHARGSGIHETQVLFAMPIEPEREVVLIVAKAETTDAITAAICERTRLDEPGKGILFVIDVGRTYGLFERA